MDLLFLIKQILGEELVAQITESDEKLLISFLNGEKYEVSVKEVSNF